MSSKCRLRRRSCQGKIRHSSLRAALAAARPFGALLHDDVEPYHCRFCHGWHIGHVVRFEQGRPGHRGRRL